MICDGKKIKGKLLKKYTNQSNGSWSFPNVISFIISEMVMQTGFVMENNQREIS